MRISRKSSTTPPRHGAGPRHPIRDRAALEELVQELADRVPGGVKGLADRSGISRATLYRRLPEKRPSALKKRPATLARDTLAQLEQVVRDEFGEEGHARFLAIMTPLGAMQAMQRYWRWAERRQTGWDGAGAFWERAMDGTLYPVTGRAARREARGKFLARLDREVRKGVSEYADFVEWMRRHRVDADRQQVAVLRILGPFLDAAESGWVEPGWEELPMEERQRYVRDAVRREQWLLERRGSAQQRAEQLAAGVVRRERPPLRVRSPEEVDAEHARANPAEHARVSAALRRQAGRRG